MFQKALEHAITRLRNAQKDRLLERFALIDGFAVSRWSIPRATSDIDFVIQLGDSTEEKLASALHGTIIKGSPRDPLLSCVTFEEHDDHGNIPVQLVRFPSAWEKIAFQNVSEDEIDGFIMPFVDWKALVLLKLYAGAAHDLADAQSILETVQPKPQELNYLKKNAASLRVSKRLERLIPK